MNAYCTVVDVQDHTKVSYSVNTAPSSSGVERFIEQGFHRINLILQQQGIDAPIPDTDIAHYSILKSLNALYAAAMAESKPSNQDRATGLEVMYARQLKELREGKIFFDEGDNPTSSGQEQDVGRVSVDSNAALDDEDEDDYFRFFARDF